MPTRFYLPATGTAQPGMVAIAFSPQWISTNGGGSSQPLPLPRTPSGSPITQILSTAYNGSGTGAAVEGSASTLPTPPDPPAPPTGTQCYSMVRGSVIRATRLGPLGQVIEPIEYATSKSITRVRVNEVTEAGSNEILRNPEEERRIRLSRPAQLIRYMVDIEFINTDPTMLNLVAGVELVYGGRAGFGETPFGYAPFGGGGGGERRVIGFDSGTRIPAVSFALEMWSKIAGPQCDGERKWGYTLFPHLRGGIVSGFKFSNGLVSFRLTKAQSRRTSRWNVGPHDIEEPFERLLTPVSGNTPMRSFLTTGTPPEPSCGLQTRVDRIDNGTAGNPMPDPDALPFIDGGGAETSPWIIEGGRAL